MKLDIVEYTFTRELTNEGWTETLEFTLPVNEPELPPEGVIVCKECGTVVGLRTLVEPEPPKQLTSCFCGCHQLEGGGWSGTCQHCYGSQWPGNGSTNPFPGQ